jgi:NAD(P)-dependent dehydrogenase (short-subunit alcohol dehydrogenase family)
MPNRTNPRATLITGCSSGIGLCLAQGLTQRGYRVFATARKPTDVERLTQLGLEALVLDVSSSESIAHAVDEVLRRTGGRLYALVNNAGYGQAGAIEDLSRDTLRAQFETNVFGAQDLTNRVLPAMRAADEGRIIQISSMLGIVCLAYRGAYNASKFALEALSDTLRLELRGSNIHVAIIEPGPIESRFRTAAFAAYRNAVDRDHSAHREHYVNVERRLGNGNDAPFIKGPEAVLEKVIHALESHRPRLRYPVTFPAHLFSWLRRLLPGRMLDAILVRVSGAGRH